MTRMRQHTPMRGQMRRLAVPLLALMAVTVCVEGDAADDDDALVVATASMEASAMEASPFEPGVAERAEILGALQKVFDALAGDAELLAEVVMPGIDMRSISVGEDGVPRQSVSSSEGLAERIGASEVTMIERMWDAEVRVSGSLAMVWTPYDFYNGDEFSHCGVDVATLHLTEDGWKLASLGWNRQQPPTCELHPDGPPGG